MQRYEARAGLADAEGGDICLRLTELGFIEGGSLRIIAFGHPGREPIAVRVDAYDNLLIRVDTGQRYGLIAQPSARNYRISGHAMLTRCRT